MFSPKLFVIFSSFFTGNACVTAHTNLSVTIFYFLILTLRLKSSWSWTCYYLLAWKTAPDRSINNKVGTGTGMIFLLLCFPGFIFPSLHMFYFVLHFQKQKQPNKKKDSTNSQFRFEIYPNYSGIKLFKNGHAQNNINHPNPIVYLQNNTKVSTKIHQWDSPWYTIRITKIQQDPTCG